jgi:allantoin racemase
VTIHLTVVNPNTTQSMTDLIEQQARRVAGPDVVVVGRTPAMGPASIESHYDEALAVPGLLDVIRSDEQADAFLLACFGDPGLDAAREVASRPVIGLAEAAMKTASLLGRSFSVVTTMSRTVGRALDLARAYGLERQCAGVHACDIPVLELEEDQERTYAVILDHARHALAMDRSDAIVLGCAGMAGLPELLTAQLGLPVVDGVAAGTVMAEGVVRLGLRPATHGELAPPSPKRYTGILHAFGDGEPDPAFHSTKFNFQNA